MSTPFRLSLSNILRSRSNKRDINSNTGAVSTTDGISPVAIDTFLTVFTWHTTQPIRAAESDIIFHIHTSTNVFYSIVVLDPSIGHTIDVLSPFISVLCHSDWLFHRESCPRLDVVHPGCVWSSSPACTWHCSLHYFFLQATPLFPHGVTTVC